MLRGSYQQQIYEAHILADDKSKLPASTHDARGRNPMVVVKDCLSPSMEEALAACGYVMEEKYSAYRKNLNLRAMRDAGTMSASKFTSRIHNSSGESP